MKRRSFSQWATTTAVSCTMTICGTAGAQPTSATDGTGGASPAQVRKLLGLENEKNPGAGLKVKVGMVLALTGPGSYFGRIQSNGAKLAAAQIKAAGGPEFQFVFKDHKSGDGQAGARAGKELGIEGVPVVLSSYVGALGSLFPTVKQYKMLALDGGGGTSNFGQGKPYFWGMRAIEPDDSFFGALKYWAATDPRVKRVSLVYIDTGPANEILLRNFKAALDKSQLTLASAEATAIGATDYSATIGRLKSTSPDAIFLFGIGVDPGYFMKQFVNAGLKMPVIGAEYVTDAAEVAGPAFDNYLFATDWFDSSRPGSAWSKLFIESYVKEFKLQPELHVANYYEDMFVVWELVRRVLAKGGNVNSGEQLQAALTEQPHFRSVYGGSGNGLGTLTLDTTTHTVTSRPLGVYKSSKGQPVPLATFDLGGENFKLVK